MGVSRRFLDVLGVHMNVSWLRREAGQMVLVPVLAQAAQSSKEGVQ